MGRYRKRPVVIEAERWTGDAEAMLRFLGADAPRVFIPHGKAFDDDDSLFIETLEGNIRADLGDWVIRGVKGEVYPIKESLFLATYEPVGDDEPLVSQQSESDGS